MATVKAARFIFSTALKASGTPSSPTAGEEHRHLFTSENEICSQQGDLDLILKGNVEFCKRQPSGNRIILLEFVQKRKVGEKPHLLF